MRRFPRRRPEDSGEFLWLMSLSDLMILLFILFVVLYSFSYKKLKETDYARIVATLSNKPLPKSPVDEAQQQVSNWVKQEALQDQISIVKKDEAVYIEIKDKVLFSSGEYRLSDEGIKRLKSLARTLEKTPEKLKLGIEGHTDDVPMSTKDVRDNWELSAKRALHVLYALELSPGLLKRTSVIAQGEMNPLVPNLDKSGNPLHENRNRNRRVTLRLF
jgi:chemotaxis protein MotB